MRPIQLLNPSSEHGEFIIIGSKSHNSCIWYLRIFFFFLSPLRWARKNLHLSATAPLALFSCRTHGGTRSQRVYPGLLPPGQRRRMPCWSRQPGEQRVQLVVHTHLAPRPAKCNEEVCLGETRRSTCLSDTVTSKPKDLIQHSAGFRQLNPLTVPF